MAFLAFLAVFSSVGVGPCYFEFIDPIAALRSIAYNRANGAGVAAGDDGAISTTTGLLPWEPRNSGTTQRLNFVGSPPFGLLDGPDNVAFFYVVGNTGTIIRSLNNGVDWSPLSSGTTRNLNGLSFVNPFQIFVVGDSGLIIKTTNGGSSWSTLTSGTTRTLRCIHAITPDIVIAGGENGTILRTSNGGTTWTSRFSDTTKTFNRIAFAIGSGGGVMWAVGNGGAIYTSLNYGDTWTPQASTTTQNLNDVYFADGTTGAAVGDNGTVRNTTNGGATWLTDSYLNSLTTEHIKCIAPVHFSILQQSAVDSVTVVGIVGNGIMTVSSEPLTQVFEPSPSLPSDFALHQNYPNPFNPTTIINFQLPIDNYVTIKVYDLLGREVATLVDEEKVPGTYTVAWNGSGHASGVYFYRLITDSFVDVKKLVLLK